MLAPDSPPMSSAPPFACPFCHAPITLTDAVCPSCQTNLAIASAIIEREVLASTSAGVATPYVSDLILPRFGDFLLNNYYITQAELDAALTNQNAAAQNGDRKTLGQTLLEMGVVTREQLDTASLQQVKQLQDMLLEINRQLENRVVQRTEELQRALQRLTELNQLKANFLAAISHELRTPLTHVKGFTEMLADEPGSGSLNDVQRDLLQSVMKAVSRLEELIIELLEYAATARGEMKLHLRPTPLLRVIEQAHRDALPKAEKSHLVLRLQAPSLLPEVSADEEKLRWMLAQLLDNAIKFTPNGGEIVLQVEPRANRYRLTVRDTGIGIPPERLPELFQPFHQLDGSSTRRYGGAGLGLALVQRLAEAHHSKVEVKSTPGQGSEFAFELPMA